MTRARFEKVHKLTAEFEGGWSNHAKDPGGKTMFGVTEAVYHDWLSDNGKPKKAVRGITMTEAMEIYFERYWLAAGCDKLNAGVDRMTYDAAVNSGVGQARKWLLASIGGPDAQTVETMAYKRMAFLRRLKTWSTFGKGWLRRVNAMKAAALGEVGTLLPIKTDEPVIKQNPLVTPAAPDSTVNTVGIVIVVLAVVLFFIVKGFM
jgi:lysozyme family protein